jgi:hypothetical protein
MHHKLLILIVIRFSLAGVTAQWYFHRHEPVDAVTANPSKAALARASTTSLGTVALGALLLSIVQFLQFVSFQVQKVNNSVSDCVNIRM